LKIRIRIRAAASLPDEPVDGLQGKTFVREPQQGQKVELVVKGEESKIRCGVVLKVNDENTIESQHLPDPKYRRWILDPGSSQQSQGDWF